MYMPVNAMVLYVSSVQTILFSNPNLNLFPILNGPKKKKNNRNQNTSSANKIIHNNLLTSMRLL